MRLWSESGPGTPRSKIVATHPRAERITEEIRQKHGELDIAVQLIRETHDEA